MEAEGALRYRKLMFRALGLVELGSRLAANETSVSEGGD